MTHYLPCPFCGEKEDFSMVENLSLEGNFEFSCTRRKKKDIRNILGDDEK